MVKKGVVKEGLVEVQFTKDEINKMLGQQYAAIVFNK